MDPVSIDASAFNQFPSLDIPKRSSTADLAVQNPPEAVKTEDNKKTEQEPLKVSPLSAPKTEPLTVSGVLKTLHNAFRSGDSSVEKFINGLDGGFKSSRASGLGRNLITADYQATRRVDKNLSIELMTQEGDRVQIELSAFMSGEERQSLARGVSSSESFRAAGAAFQYSVEGDLSAEEMQAIDGLMTSLSDSVSSFYERDLMGSLSSLSQIDFDAAYLSGFSLDMRQTAVATYQSIEKFEGPVVGSLAPQGLGDMARHMKTMDDFFTDVLEQAKALSDQGIEGLLGLILPTALEGKSLEPDKNEEAKA